MAEKAGLGPETALPGARRTLMAVSTALAVSRIAGVTVGSDLSQAGTTLHFERPQLIPVLLLVAWAYLLWYFCTLVRDSAALRALREDRDQRLSLRLIAWMRPELLREARALLAADPVARPADYELEIGAESCNHETGLVTGTAIVASNKRHHHRGIGAVRAQCSPVVLWFLRTRSGLRAAVSSSSFSSHLFPIIFAVVSAGIFLQGKLVSAAVFLQSKLALVWPY